MADKAHGDVISVAEVISPQEMLATLAFKYTKKELDSFLGWRTAGLAYKSSVWIIKAAEVFWTNMRGTISKDSYEALRAFLFKKYDDYYVQSEVLNFSKGFLKLRQSSRLILGTLRLTCSWTSQGCGRSRRCPPQLQQGLADKGTRIKGGGRRYTNLVS
ncbi:MAG: hypothetical protein ACXV5E_07785 [Halobacteriota archaeon]